MQYKPYGKMHLIWNSSISNRGNDSVVRIQYYKVIWNAHSNGVLQFLLSDIISNCVLFGGLFIKLRQQNNEFTWKKDMYNPITRKQGETIQCPKNLWNCSDNKWICRNITIDHLWNNFFGLRAWRKGDEMEELRFIMLENNTAKLKNKRRKMSPMTAAV